MWYQNWRLPGVLIVMALVALAVAAVAQEPPQQAPKSPPPSPKPKGTGRNRPLATKDFLVPHPDLPGTRLVGLHAESNAPNAVGEPTVPSRERRYYYLPPIALQAKDGELQV